MARMLTDTGLETMLVFRHGVDLPEFAAFPLLDDPQGRDLLASCYRRHLQLASERGTAISFRAAGADRVTVLTVTHASEAIGIVNAAVAEAMDVVVSFTTETDGRLPSGQPLLDAVGEVDAATDGAALHFGVNCAHPDHFAAALVPDDARSARIALIRANASRMSHEELDNADELDDGDPDELGAQYRALLDAHPHLQVLGGCCGTDPRHLDAISRACL